MITKERRKYLKKYHSRPENKEKQRIRARLWARNNKDKCHLQHKKWSECNPDKVREHQKRYEEKLARRGLSLKELAKQRRVECLNYYGNGDPQCLCCGEKQVKFLALDHKLGGGNQHRKGKGNIVRWIIKNNFPDIFQILCHNCNQAKGYYGVCPHQEKDASPQSSLQS